MPQMSPLMWLIFIISTMSLLLFIISFIYFFHTPSPLPLSSSNMMPSPLFPKLSSYPWLW